MSEFVNDIVERYTSSKPDDIRKSFLALLLCDEEEHEAVRSIVSRISLVELQLKDEEVNKNDSY